MAATTPSTTTYSVHYKMTVASAGTAEPLIATTQPVKSITIVPWSGNTGKIFIGGSDISSSIDDGWTATDSIRIAPGRGFIDPTEYFLDSSVSAEGANIIYMLQ